MNYQLAQVNVARMKGVNIDDPIMKEFVDSLDKVNAVAEASDGFVWRLKDESNNATSQNPFNDEQVIINLSVWESIQALENYVYRSFHTDFLRRKKEWFQTYGKTHTVLWWVKSGEYPTVEQALLKLQMLEAHGPSLDAFNFRTKYPQPT